MTKLSDIITETAEAVRQDEREPLADEYKGDDGLIYCAKCRTPRQARYEHFGGITLNVPCKCEGERNAAMQDEERRQRAAIEREFGAHERQKYCFSDEQYKGMTFADDNGSSPQAIKAAHYYADHFEQLAAGNMGLMFLGNVGTGKTFAACCIANALVEKGYRVWVITAGDLLRAANDFKTQEETFDKLRYSDLVVLDDVGVQNNTGNNLDLLFSCVDARSKSKKPLIITSNLPISEFKNNPNLQLQRPYNRIYEMCSCPISPVILKGKSIRDDIARAKHEAVI